MKAEVRVRWDGLCSCATGKNFNHFSRGSDVPVKKSRLVTRKLNRLNTASNHVGE